MTKSTHKFGGASVRDASAIQRVAALLTTQLQDEEQAVVVVSAMGKTTNHLEHVWKSQGEERDRLWFACIDEHMGVGRELNLPEELLDRLTDQMNACYRDAITCEKNGLTEASYDSFVAAGEMASTILVQGWFQQCGIPSVWWDVRQTILTSGPHRSARVQELNLGPDGASLRRLLTEKAGRFVVVTQGFIGRHEDGRTSTLGREGSDYSAALLAVAVGTSSVTIWKDVPGMMNADPKRYPEAVTVPKVDYAEAIELSYYGASVIHPRTIKPLQKGQIPLHVRSFVDPEGPFTTVHNYPGLTPDVPMFIWREDQSWIEVYTLDGSFLAEDHLTELFGMLDESGIHVRLMQQSATHFGLLTDRDEKKLKKLTDSFNGAFMVQIQSGLVLLTVRHGSLEFIQRLTAGRSILVEQRAEATWRRVLGD